MSTREFEDAQIFRTDSRGRILDCTDNDPNPLSWYPKKRVKGQKWFAPRLALNYCRYEEEKGALAQHTHYMEVDAIHVLANLLIRGAKGEKSDSGFAPIVSEFKGGPARKRDAERFGVDLGHVLSRTLTVAFNDKLNMGPCYTFSFVVQDGRVGGKGEVAPIRMEKPYLKEQFALSLPEALQMGLSVDRWIQAKFAAALSLRFQNQSVDEESDDSDE